MKFKPRPYRRHNKVGIIERKNGTIKRIIEKLQNDEGANEDAVRMAQKAIFLSNVFSGSKLLSSFELSREYTPSLVASGSRGINPEFLQAHAQQTAIRVLHRLLPSRTPQTLNRTAINVGDRVFYYYNSSKQNEAK